MANVAEILRMPYARVVTPESDGSFRAEVLEFPGCIALGDTAALALESLERVAAGWLETTIEQGLAIPPPFEQKEGYSGKFVLRLSKSLHRRSAHAAKREGVSLNNFITTALAICVGTAEAKTSVKTSAHNISHVHLEPTFNQMFFVLDARSPYPAYAGIDWANQTRGLQPLIGVPYARG